MKNALIPFTIFIQNRQLLTALIKQLWVSRGKGGFLPLLWPLLTPVFLLLIYYFSFGVILNLRNIPGESNYTLTLFCGIAVFNIFTESFNNGASSIISQPQYVKNATFPLEVLPLSTVGAATISGLIYLVITIIGTMIFGTFNFMFPLCVLCLIPYLLFCSGVALFAGALSVFIRDFPIFAALIQQGLFFLTPIIYPISVIPGKYRFYFQFNPLVSYVESVRNVVLNGNMASVNWYMLWGYGLLFYLAGFFFFHKTKKGFADVI